MADLWVGAGEKYTTLTAAIKASSAGDTVYVRAGTYINDSASISHDLSIIGVGGPVVLQSTHWLDNGKAILITNANVHLENLEFTGATASDNNGEGVRMSGGHLEVVNCYFHDNQEGILTGDDPNGTLVITNSRFERNGYGDGYTHGVYVNHIASVTVTGSYFADQNVGHHLKSRAAMTVVTNNIFDDGNSTTSYSIDMPSGGVGVITGNYIYQGASSQNPIAIHFGGEQTTKWPNSSLTVEGNVIVNDRASGVAVNNSMPESLVTIDGNAIWGETTSTAFSGPVAAHDNVFMSSADPGAPATITVLKSYLATWLVPNNDVPSHAYLNDIPTPVRTGVALNAAGKGALFSGTNLNDTLTGNYGPDTLAGGGGDDVYTVRTSRTTVVEDANGGNDTIYSEVSYTLPANFENLVLKNSSWSTATGNALDNVLVGEKRSTLDGGAGDDTLVAGSTPTIMIGGTGDDTFSFRDYAGAGSTISDFQLGHDRIDLTRLALPSTAMTDGTVRFVASGDGADLIVGTTNLAHLKNVSAAGLSASDVWITAAPRERIVAEVVVISTPGDDNVVGGSGTTTFVLPNQSYGSASVTTNGNSTVVSGVNGTDTLTGVQRLQFSDGVMLLDLGPQALVGEAYRLYAAALGRQPDEGGLRVQVDALAHGMSLTSLAQNFLGSSEFVARYGANASADTYVDALYQNVLGRQPDAAGRAVQLDALAHGLSRASLLANFSESAENHALTGAMTAMGAFVPLVGAL
ncbi:MAG: putative pectin lyase [Rhodospirillales bacterium]|nr:putative pectin lyase [Rhodospirillales bacterium]